MYYTLGGVPWGGWRWPTPLAWLRSKWGAVTGLPARLKRTEDAARAIARDGSRSAADRRTAGVLASAAMFDRVEVEKLLRDKLRVKEDSLEAVPIILLVGGATAIAVATTLVAVFGRASTYEKELEALTAGEITVGELRSIRRGAPVAGGVAASIREAGNLVKVALVAAGGFLAWKQWGRG